MPDSRLGAQEVEFDEDQRFTVLRVATLVLYPHSAQLAL